MASPQLENGYTRIANELLEQISAANFTASEYKIILTVIRLTYGFQRKSASVSLDTLADACNIHRRTVSKEIKKLIENGVLIEVSPADFFNPREIALNKNYEKWVAAIPTVEPSATVGLQATPQAAHRQHNSRSAGNTTLYKEKYKEIYKKNSALTREEAPRKGFEGIKMLGDE